MGIGKTLLKAQFERLQKDFYRLRHTMSLHPTEETPVLERFIDQRISQLAKAQVELYGEEDILKDVDLSVMNVVYRELKLQLRFAQRKWHRMLVNESKMQKRHEEGRAQIATIAA